MDPSQKQMFTRQITLSEIGVEGQKMLQKAKVLIVGCGGLGSPVAVYLASSGVGQMHLVDFDKVDVSNLHRQVFYELNDVGKYKSQVLTNFIQKRAPFTEVTYSTTALTKENVLDFVKNYDVVVDGTDSLPTKYLVNDACVLLEKPLVYGSLYKYDGYVSTFNFDQNSANLRDAFPVMQTDVPNCEEAGTLNAIVGLIALTQVNEVLKIITGVGEVLSNELLVYNALKNSQLKIKLKPKESNFLDRKKRIKEIFLKESYDDFSCDNQNPDWLITRERLLDYKESERNLKIISVINNLETSFEVDEFLTLPQVNNYKINLDDTYVFICKRGITSYKAIEVIKKKHPEAKVFSLKNGVSEFREKL